MRMFSKIRFTTFLVYFFAFSSGHAEAPPKDAQLAQEGWRILSFEGKNENQFTKKDGNIIVVQTDNSVSVLYKKISVDVDQTPNLSWSWRVDHAVPASNLEEKGKDDRSLALYVSFPFDEKRAGFWERFIRAFVIAFKGEDTPGRVLSYVWGSTEEHGTVLQSPYLKSAGALIVLRGKKDVGGTWYRETVDIGADYQRIFGVPANQPFQIAVSADSDDSQASSLGYVKDIAFTR